MPKIEYEIEKHSGIIEANENETLFNALESQSLLWPHGCLAGACGACRTEILEGEKNLSVPSAVEKDTLEKIREEQSEADRLRPMRLACRAKLLGDVKIRPFTQNVV